MSNKIKILRTPNGDTRTLKVLDRGLVFEDTENHINAVRDILDWIALELHENGRNHDYTKTGKYFDSFFEALSSGKTGEEFYKLDWWKLHSTKERHHLNQYAPEDVNLLDVLEMLVDCVTAGLARSGNIYPIKLSNELLQKAVENTVKLLIDNIEVENE